ncbi:MAG: carboxypeptidase regulatory-like domain-containing protein [Myxococcales bacterium]|nr:carboxypeptidase regulatory-like domain-containing protein [Myxococcales bacterium]
MARALVALLALAVVAAAPAPARARPPTVTIRARAELVLGSVRRTDDGRVRIRGTLHDRASGSGLGGEAVDALAGGATGTGITSPDGSFEILVAPGDGPLDITLSYAGSAGIDLATASATNVDPTKAAVDMVVTTSVTPAGVLVTATTSSDGTSIEVPVVVRVSPTDRDEPHHDAAGRSNQPIMITRADALGPGARRLTASFAGDAGHAPATVTTVVELTSDTAITIDAPGAVAYDATLRLRGRVVDADGAGVAKVTVTMTGADKRRLGSAVSGADGTFRVAAEASLLGTGRHGVVVAAEPRESWLRPSQSPIVFVTVGAPRPAPVAITIAAFAATALTALGFILARRRRERQVAAATVEADRPHQAPRGGLEPARPSLVSTLRRAADHGFAGLVRDSVRGRPIADATVELTLGGELRSAITTADGRFAVEALPIGEWSARVTAAGHMGERFSVTIPHRGELRGARIDLVAVRERAFAIYRTAALPLLPRPELWGIWSPRQIVDYVRTRRPPAALTDLTATIEEIYFSGRVFDEAIVPTVESKARAAIAERTAGIAV